MCDDAFKFTKNIFATSKLESKVAQYFRIICQAMNGFAILWSNLPHRPLLNKKKKTKLALPVITP